MVNETSCASPKGLPIVGYCSQYRTNMEMDMESTHGHDESWSQAMTRALQLFSLIGWVLGMGMLILWAFV